MSQPRPTSLIDELEARQDEVIEQLDELDKKILLTIDEFLKAHAAEKEISLANSAQPTEHSTGEKSVSDTPQQKAA